MEQINNNRFISFEGIDYSGKTTQINLLKTHLESKGHEVYVLREPGGTAISERIRDLLLDKQHFEMSDRAEILLYSAARVQLVTEKIIPLLKKNNYVIADRYVDSTTAYQGYGRGIDPEIVEMINRAATFDLLPAVTFYLKITPEAAHMRHEGSQRQKDRLEEAGIEFFRRVFNGYDEIAEKEPQRFITIDALLAVDDIHHQILKMLK